jgi:hypothetical protein
MKSLHPNQSIDYHLKAKEPWGAPGIRLEARHAYRFEVLETKNLGDSWISTGPEGFSKWWMRPFESSRRMPGLPWFRLIGTVGRNLDHTFSIGGGLDAYSPPLAGEFFCFLNDAPSFYWNNHGSLDLRITRL